MPLANMGSYWIMYHRFCRRYATPEKVSCYLARKHRLSRSRFHTRSPLSYHCVRLRWHCSTTSASDSSSLKVAEAAQRCCRRSWRLRLPGWARNRTVYASSYAWRPWDYFWPFEVTMLTACLRCANWACRPWRELPRPVPSVRRSERQLDFCSFKRASIQLLPRRSSCCRCAKSFFSLIFSCSFE